MRKENLDWVEQVVKKTGAKIPKNKLVEVIITNLNVRRETAEDYIKTLVTSGRIKNKYGMVYA